MQIPEACEALRNRKQVEIVYDGQPRLIEFHTIGFSKDGRPIARVWQVQGGSNSGDGSGWKLLRLNDVQFVKIAEGESEAPRSGYKWGDRAITDIRCEL
jgi:hypothetical protein